MRRAHRLPAGLLTAGALLPASASCAQEADRSREAVVVGACGRPSTAGGSRVRPQVHWWQDGVGRCGGGAADADAGCARR